MGIEKVKDMIKDAIVTEKAFMDTFRYAKQGAAFQLYHEHYGAMKALTDVLRALEGNPDTLKIRTKM
jgi:hypothetical protein